MAPSEAIERIDNLLTRINEALARPTEKIERRRQSFHDSPRLLSIEQAHEQLDRDRMWAERRARRAQP